MSRYPENGSWGIQALPLQPGQQLKFDGDHRWWTVKAVSPHYAALTRQEAFAPKGTLCYTVIDWDNGVRGPCDLIGQGWGDGTYSEAECAELLSAFETGRALDNGAELDRRAAVRVSQRNWLRINISSTVRESAS